MRERRGKRDGRRKTGKVTGRRIGRGRLTRDRAESTQRGEIWGERQARRGEKEEAVGQARSGETGASEL